MAVPPINDGSWSLWEVFLSLFSGGGLLTMLGGLIWFSRKDGQKDEALEKLRIDLDHHVESDTRMFNELRGLIAGNAKTQDARHEENIKAIAALPDKQDFRDFKADMKDRFDELMSLVRADRSAH